MYFFAISFSCLAPESLIVSSKGNCKDELMEESKQYPELVLNSRQLCDIELILNGGFNPLNGFLNKKDTESVYENYRLSNGKLWPIPINLDILSSNVKNIGDSSNLTLRDYEGNLIAVIDLEDAWSVDKEREAQQVFGGDSEHPAIQYLKNNVGDVYLGGTLRGYQLPQHYDYNTIRHTPQSLREHFRDLGWEPDDSIVAFQTRNPMHRAHVELVKRAANENNANILIHPVVGMTKPGDIDYHTRIKCIRTVVNNGDLIKGKCTISALPLAMRMAGPREALWHMLIRKNYGATHFILGRDHAGPGSNSEGKDFYGPYEARDFGIKHSKEVGIKTCDFEQMIYHADKKTYINESDVKPDDINIRKISGTEVRRRLETGEDIPEWFSSPDVIKLLRKTYPPRDKIGICLFFTGFSGSGKSTIANALVEKFLELNNDRKVTLLDGDHVRHHLSSELGFSREHRDLNIQRIGFVASEIVKHGGVAICAAIAPYKKARNLARSMVEQHGVFIEIHVNTSIEECELRDRKGLYNKARSGIIKGMTGIDDPYEVPTNPEIKIDTGNGVSKEVQQIFEYLYDDDLVRRN